MIRASMFLAAVVALSPSLAAYAQPTQSAQVDTKGWTLLGEQSVQGKRDRDTINVGKYEGKFDQLQLVVLDSDIELKDMTVFFENGEKWSPALKHSFKEGQRSKQIDLPGNNRRINKIELLYANTPGGGRAKVAVYGRDKHSNNAPATPPPNASFDSTGWTMLGDQTIDVRRGSATIKASKYAGQFDQISLVVPEGILELQQLTIKFGDQEREQWSPNIPFTFRNDQRSWEINLPGKDRVTRRLDLKFAAQPNGGKLKIQVFGRDQGRKPPPEIKPIAWENTGWTFLGKTTVDGWRDRDRLDVNQPNPFTEVMFVVAGSDVELKNVTITLGNGEKFSMKQSVIFKEGTRTSPIDIPGKVRKIKSIDFAYANLPGGGRAQVEVWARKKGTGTGDAQHQTPPPPPPAPNGNTGVVPPVIRDHR